MEYSNIAPKQAVLHFHTHCCFADGMSALRDASAGGSFEDRHQ
jgi:hypothetical protein